MAVTRERLTRALAPKVVAVIGDKQASGYNWLRSMKEFDGPVYSVQVDESEIPGIEELGIPNYKSLTDIPEQVDFAVCAVPRQVAPFIVQGCVEANVGGVTLFTSGFAETGEDIGVELQQKVFEIADPAGLALIGPNCMGLHVPGLGVRFNRDQPAGVQGNIGFVSQSGTHGMNFSLTGAAHGLYCSTLVSFGNGIILEAADYLEYLADDPQTEVIGMYIEGARDGRRLFKTLREVAAKKPVVIWKGGQTEGGGRAIRSHTASLASDQAIWEAMIRQVGAVAVHNLDEMIDVVKATLLTKRTQGNRLGLIAMTGGQSVVLTDAFEKAGWKVPTLSEGSYAQLSEFFNIIGGSYRNPLDAAGTIGQDPKHLDTIFDILNADENIDAVGMELSATFMARRWQDKPEEFDRLIGSLKKFMAESEKPFLAALHPSHVEEAALTARMRLQEEGIPTFPSFERAANALRKASSLAAV